MRIERLSVGYHIFSRLRTQSATKFLNFALVIGNSLRKKIGFLKE
jgi:hypothetical protein